MRSAPRRSFNPHPARRPGAAGTSRTTRRRAPRFNPHPARRPGAAGQRIGIGDWRPEFQSSPGPEAGCCDIARIEDQLVPLEFQSSPGPEAGCCPTRTPEHTNAEVFQSSPGPEAGCCRPVASQCAPAKVVSILTRPGGRVLPVVVDSGLADDDEFQSSPGPEAGCCRSHRRAPRRGDAVSILTRPGGRVLRNPHRRRTSRYRVSILTRPARRPGAAGRAGCGRGAALREFESSPGPEAGCCLGGRSGGDRARPVSILTRPGGRVLRDSSTSLSAYLSRFQSSPGPEAGCCRPNCDATTG